MFQQVDDFLKAFAQQAESTKRIFAAMTDQSLNQAVAEGHRTLGRIAWHVVATIPEMMGRVGLGLTSVDAESSPPAKAAEIVGAYEQVTGELIGALRGSWTDETLKQVDDMYGQKWPRGVTLAVLLSHEVHHRGQMTVLLRQAGLVVPGIMGPAKEEWTQFGMEEPLY